MNAKVRKHSHEAHMEGFNERESQKKIAVKRTWRGSMNAKAGKNSCKAHIEGFNERESRKK